MSSDEAAPDGYFPGAVEVGRSGVFIALGDGPADTIVWHRCLARWDGAYIRDHAIVSRDPLTITASIACRDCSWHGFITNGEWIPV